VLNFWNARSILFRARTAPWAFARHVKPMLTVYAMNFIISLYINLDTVLLGFLSSADSVGYYATSMRITKMVMGVVISMGSVILPRLAFFLQNGQQKEFDAMVRKSFAILLLMCLPAVSGLMMLAPEMMTVFAGGKFDAAVLCMQITAPVILIIGISNLLGFQILYPLGKDRLVVLYVSIGAVVSLALNAVLIPRLAHLGAAIATVTAETTVIVAQVIMIRRNYHLPMPWTNVARYLAGTGAMCLALWGSKGLVAHDGLRLIVAVPLGAATYFGVVAALRDDFLIDNLKALRNKVSSHA
jgi:O-antigen/teichoic acid export membrane protein